MCAMLMPIFRVIEAEQILSPHSSILFAIDVLAVVFMFGCALVIFLGLPLCFDAFFETPFDTFARYTHFY